MQQFEKHGRPAMLLTLLIWLGIGFAGSAGAQEVQYATSLEIDLDCEYAAIVTVRDAWPEAPPLRYALVERGDPRPANDEFYAVISVPVERVVSLSTTALPHIMDLGMVDRLVGVDSGAYIYDETIHRRVVSGLVEEIGSAESFDLERLVAVQPDVVLTSAMGPDDPTVQRLAAVGTPVLILADWREGTPLGRAEWIRLFGLLFGRDGEAQERFADRAERYEVIAAQVASIPTEERPSILVNAPWQGAWPIPGGDSYMATLFADAGGRYLWADRPGGGSHFLDLEAVLQRGANADYWFNLNFGWRSREDARNLDSRLTAFRAFQERRMYHYIGRVQPWGANDFWESGAARPDLILSDLVRILHPEILPDHQLVYYRRLD